VVTATNSFVTAPIARAFGIPHLVATDAEVQRGRYTGRILGTPSFKEGKVVRVNDWLAAMGLGLADFPESFFYSDSVNDVPLLEKVTRPIAANPSPTLRAIAQERGWQVIDLFDHVIDAKS
jgi:HAD superfamily phosphoserine phosphatase-like hydrolase